MCGLERRAYFLERFAERSRGEDRQCWLRNGRISAVGRRPRTEQYDGEQQEGAQDPTHEHDLAVGLPARTALVSNPAAARRRRFPFQLCLPTSTARRF